MENTTEFMKRLDDAYRRRSGLSDRRFYSIFYSQINPSQLFIIGFNPGGNPETWSEEQLTSVSYFENNEHEYVDADYKIATAMRSFLVEAMNLDSAELIRNIPKTNLIFRRSSSQGSLNTPESIALEEAKPIFNEILLRVRPKVVLCEGITTLRQFKRLYCDNVHEEIDGQSITTPNGRNDARIYQADKARVIATDDNTTLIGIGHPSKYSSRAEWSDVTRLVSQYMGELNIGE